MKYRHLFVGILLIGLSVCFCITGFAYVLSGKSWQDGGTSIYSAGTSDSYWNNAFIQAMQYWSILPGFAYTNINGFADPCANPYIRSPRTGWEFRYDICGAAFGRNTLAVNLTWSVGDKIIQAGTVFNANQPWDVHSGHDRTYFDFRRVAAHELGHALGLEHENIQPALMNPFYSGSIEAPQADDINGLTAIYGSAMSISVPVYRFWNPVTGRHYYTTSEQEKNNFICCDPAVSFEGIAWYAYSNQQPNTVPVHRFYSQTLEYHFYTANEAEKAQLICCSPDWQYQGIVWYAYPNQQLNTIPVYRFYNSALSEHFFTAGESEKAQLTCCGPGWSYEGVAYYTLSR